MNWATFAPLAARELLVPPFTMPQLLADAAVRCPHAIWIDGKYGRWTYAEGLATVHALAAAWRQQGVRPKDHVAICLANGPAAAIAVHALWHAGAVPALLHPAYAPDIQRQQITLVSPRLLIGSDDRAAQLAKDCSVDFLPLDDAPRPHPEHKGESTATPDIEDLALLQFTGGTTGAPKAAMLSHRNLSAGLGQIALALPTLVAEQEISIAIAPFSHITGLNGVLGLMTYTRGRILVPPPAPASLASACAQSGTTYLAGPPTMLTALVEAQQAKSLDYTLRHVIAGGAPLPSEVKERFEHATGATVFDGYGLSETAPAVSLAGWPVTETTIEIRCPDTGALFPSDRVGEVCVAGPQVMQGYWQNETETSAALVGGWLRTGDLGSVNDKGRLAMVDRVKEIIIASGYNIYPSRVENAICRHPAVREVAVVGLPDAYRGETVAAAIALRPGHQLSLSQLTDFLSGQISSMEMPRKLVIWNDLPKSPAGKILRRSVRTGMEDLEKET
jgi:long-chain acyl-CoA synthetase